MSWIFTLGMVYFILLLIASCACCYMLTVFICCVCGQVAVSVVIAVLLTVVPSHPPFSSGALWSKLSLALVQGSCVVALDLVFCSLLLRDRSIDNWRRYFSRLRAN